jgi:hypothetical protein
MEMSWWQMMMGLNMMTKQTQKCQTSRSLSPGSNYNRNNSHSTTFQSLLLSISINARISRRDADSLQHEDSIPSPEIAQTRPP